MTENIADIAKKEIGAELCCWDKARAVKRYPLAEAPFSVQLNISSEGLTIGYPGGVGSIEGSRDLIDALYLAISDAEKIQHIAEDESTSSVKVPRDNQELMGEWCIDGDCTPGDTE